MSTNETSSSKAEDFALDQVLESLGGDLALLDTLGRIYQEDYPILIVEMEAASNSLNALELQSSTHKLRGLVANFRDVRLAEMLGELEKRASIGDLSQSPNLIPVIRQRCDWLSSALTAAIDKT